MSSLPAAPLRVGLAGAGHISSAHLRGWRRAPGCRVEGIFDRDRGRAEARARQFRVARVFGEFDELVAACDVIDICTPPATHAALARAALSRRRHLLVEKPLATGVAEWEELVARLDGGVRLAVVHNLKFSRAVQRARGWLQEGRIGRVLRFSREFLTDPASDRMLREGSHWSHRLPGGRWAETLPHELYLLHFLVGPLAVREVAALPAGEGATAAEVLVTLAGGDTLATLHYSSRCRLNRRRLELSGTEGRIEIDLLSDSARLSRRRDRRWQRAAGHLLLDGLSSLAGWPGDRADYLWRRLRRESAHGRLIAAFGRHLRDGGPSPTPLEEIDYVMRKAAEIGQAIERQLGRA